jgi:hypothetical protein
VDADSPDALPAAFDFAGVNSRPHAHTEPERRVLHCARGGHGL